MDKQQRKRRALFWTDLLLIPVFIATAISGLGLHYAGHNEPHEIWENWSLVHVISAVLWLGLGIYHIYRHWAWYKSLFKSTKGKSLVSILLSFVFLILIVTGIILLGIINGPNSHIGLLHYIIGLVLIVLSLIHIITRWRTLIKLRK